MSKYITTDGVQDGMNGLLMILRD